MCQRCWARTGTSMTSACSDSRPDYRNHPNLSDEGSKVQYRCRSSPPHLKRTTNSSMMGSFLSFFKVVVVVCLFFTFFYRRSNILSLKDALHLILSLRDFEFQSSYHITRKKRFLPLGTSGNNYRKIHIPGIFLTLPLHLFASSQRTRTILCSLQWPWSLKIGLACWHGSLMLSKRGMHFVPWNLKLSKLPYFFCVVSDSVLIVLEEALCSIEFGGLRRIASAEASGGLRGLCRL